MEDYWSYCGEIESLDLMRFPDTGRFKGIAFITFKTVSCFLSTSCGYVQQELQHHAFVTWCFRKKDIRQPWSAMA